MRQTWLRCGCLLTLGLTLAMNLRQGVSALRKLNLQKGLQRLYLSGTCCRLKHSVLTRKDSEEGWATYL